MILLLFCCGASLAVQSYAAGPKPARKPRQVPYNGLIQVDSTPPRSRSPLLICDGRAIDPRPTAVKIPADKLTRVGDAFPSTLTGISLEYAGVANNKFDVRRTLTLHTNSDQLNREIIVDGSESHGCDSEVYPADSNFEVSGTGGVTLVSSVFAAFRVCVNRYWGGRASICGAEGYLKGRFPIAPKEPQTYDECVCIGRSPSFLRIEGQLGHVSGIHVNNCAIGTVSNFSPFPDFDKKLKDADFVRDQLPTDLKSTATAYRTGAQMELRREARACPKPPSVSRLNDITLCPWTNKATLAGSSKELELAVTERRLLSQTSACMLYDQLNVSLHSLAEQLRPTAQITIEPNDSWWSVTQRLWGKGDLYPVLRKANSSVRTLHPGTELRVPNLNEMLSDPSLVKPGDSLWSMSIRLSGSPRKFMSLHKRLHPGSPSPDRIYPYAVVDSAKTQ